MTDFLSNLINLLRLRAGPQDLPASWALTIMVVAIYLGQGVLTTQQLDSTGDSARTLLSAVLQIVALAAMLGYRRFPERFQQTLLALAGTGIVIGLIAFGLLVQADPDKNQPLLALAWFAVFGWSLLVDANIYRHALAVPLSVAMLITVLLLALTYVIGQFLFGVP